MVYPYYLVKDDDDATWTQVRIINGLTYEAGYEYRIEARDISENGTSYDEWVYEVVTIISKEQKDSSGLPKYLYDESWPPLYPAENIDYSKF